jgi:hypothetical protein
MERCEPMPRTFATGDVTLAGRVAPRRDGCTGYNILSTFDRAGSSGRTAASLIRRRTHGAYPPVLRQKLAPDYCCHRSKPVPDVLPGNYAIARHSMAHRRFRRPPGAGCNRLR